MLHQNKQITEAIENINEEISDLKKRKEFLQNITIKSVTCKEWHELCRTPIRSSKILLEFAKRTFIMGTDFELGYNYVRFKWDKFEILCPTSECITFEVGVGSNGIYSSKPIMFESYGYEEAKKTLKYVDAIKTKQNIFKRATLFYPYLNPFFAILKYLVNGLWKEKKSIEKIKNEVEAYRTNYEKRKKEYEKNLHKYEEDWLNFFTNMYPFILDWYGDNKPMTDIICHALSDNEKERFIYLSKQKHQEESNNV